MQVGMKSLGAFLLCAVLSSAQEDGTIVESPYSHGDEEEAVQQDDAPAVDQLPDWLIDIPAEDAGSLSPRFQAISREYETADKHVVSQSRMFSVSGGDALRMGAIASHADELRNQFNKLLDTNDSWKYAISIRLLGNTADPARPFPIRTRVRILGSEPNLQIRIHSGGGINIAKLDEAIISMLLYEYALRSIQPSALPDYLEMPPWLITGMQQAILWKRGKIDRRLYQNLFNKADMMAPEDIVSTEDPAQLDAGSRQVYEVSCGVLIMGLMNRPNGAAQLRNLLSEALTQEGKPKEVIAAHFHEMDVDRNSFSKWWALELAALSVPRATETLTPIESERMLAEALMITGVNQENRLPISVSVADVHELIKLPDWQLQLRPCMDRLVELSLRCFPGYRAMIMEYCRAITELIKGAPAAEVEKILEPLKELRTAYMDASIRGRDYLDWYEITQLGSSRHTDFNTYSEAMRMLRKETPGPVTPISRYLDDIEALHSLKEGESLPDSIRKKTRSK